MPLKPADERLRVPPLAYLAAAFVSLAFVVGAFDALITNHFSSWSRLTLEPSEDLPKAIEQLVPAARFVAMAGAAVFGYSTLRRASEEGYRPGLIRLGVVTFSPIFVELSNIGTQDGQVPDLDKLPIHSVLLLMMLVLAPAVVAAWDARVIRRHAQEMAEENGTKTIG